MGEKFFQQPEPAAGNERREQVAARYDDPLWQEQDRELLKTRLGRWTLAARREHVFKYGYCEQDHPLQAYVQAIAQQHPALKAYRIFVTPGDRSTNAGALSDGTIFITPTLICRTKTREALLGVLLHEARHISRQHFRHALDRKIEVALDTEQQRNASAAQAGVGAVGLSRIHENMADLRGAMMGLDEMGFNPRGYIEFLQEIALSEAKQAGDVAHGDTQDRALKGIELMAALHFQSSARPLHELDPDRLNWANEKAGAHTWPAFRQALYDKKGEDARVLARERHAAIDVLPVCLVPAAMNAMVSELYRRDAQDQRSLKRRMAHDLFFPTIAHGCRRLVEASLGTGAKERDDIGAQVAVGHAFCTYFPLPQKGYAPVWDYMRADLSYMLFRQQGIPQFLRVLEQVSDPQTEERTGLFHGDHFIDETYLDWLITQVPTVPATPEAMDEWWKLVLPMAHDVSVRPGEDYAELTGQYPSAYKAAEELFQRWIVAVWYKTPPKSSHDRDLFLKQPNIADLKQALFTRPLAAKLERTDGSLVRVVSARASDPANISFDEAKGERAVHFAIKQLWSEYLERELYTQADVVRVLDACFEAFNKFSAKEDVFARLKSMMGNTSIPFHQLVLCFLVRRIVLDHPAFASEIDALKRAGMWLFIDQTVRPDVSRYEHLLPEEDFWDQSHGESEPSLKNGVGRSAVIYIKKEYQRLNKDEACLHQVTPDNVFDAIRLCKEYFDIFNTKDYMSADRYLSVVSRYLGQALASCTSIRAGLALLHDSRTKELLEKNVNDQRFDGPWVARIAREIESGRFAQLSLEERRELGSFLHEASLRSTYADVVASSPQFRALPMQDQIRHVMDMDGAGMALATGRKTLEWLLEQKTLNQTDYRVGADALEKYAHRVEEKGSVSYGVYVLLERLYEALSLDSILAFVKASLEARRTDEPLKNFLLEFVIQHAVDLHITEGHNPATTLDDDQALYDNSAGYKRVKLLEEKEDANTMLLVADGIYEDLLRIPDGVRHIIASKILGGKRGLLRQPETRQKLFQILREAWVDDAASQGVLMDTMRQVEVELAKDDEWEAMYLGLVGVLRDQLFQRSRGQNVVPWEQTKRAQAIEKDLGTKLEYTSLALWDKPPEIAQRFPWRYPLQWTRYAEERCRVALQQQAAKTGTKPEPSAEGLPSQKSARSPMAFAAEVASHASAIGVRSVQNIDQVVAELTRDERRDLSHVYDAVRGQARIAALIALERNWPEVWEEYAEIGARIGGGSIFTVFRGRTHRGENRVIKVVNPNIDLHVERAGGLMQRTAERLAMKYGGTYQLVPGLIADQQEWVRREASFAGFLEKDRDFRSTWNGFAEGGDGYRIYVPRSYGPENELFVQEEFVDSKNLTRWDELLSEKHDLRAVTRLLSVAYIGQLLQGRALSDIHVGNEAVTKDREVVLFDRVLYLDLSETEQAVLRALFASADQKQRADALEGYLVQLSGQSLPRSVRKQIDRSLKRMNVSSSHELLLALRQANIRLPLEMALPLKNIRVLDGLCRKAGWKQGMIEAVNA